MNSLSKYIRQFAAAVRSGISSEAYNTYVQNIEQELSEIENTSTRIEAKERLTRISKYLGVYITDSKKSRSGIADKIEDLAN